MKLKPRLANSAIAFLPWLSLALVGCQSTYNDGANLAFKAPKDAVQLGLDQDDKRSDLYLFSGTKSVNVGDDPADSFTGGFRKPDKALRLNRLPVGFDDTFIADGWELADRSVGCISRNHNILIFIDSSENVDQSKIDRDVAAYTAKLGKPSSVVNNEHSRYYFWEQNGIRLMVCSTLDSSGRLAETGALGLDPLMDRFHMDSKSAAVDGTRAEEMIKPSGRSNSAG